jgi:hypothetical protein
MSLQVGENYFYGYEILTADEPSESENQTAPVEETPAETRAPRNNPKLPPIPHSVDFTALSIDTELKLARAAFMAAAAKAGISDVGAQSSFADRMLAANSSELKLTDENIPLDDAKVRARLTNREVRFTLSADEKAALREFRQQYLAAGGKVRSNQKPIVDLRQARTAEGVTLSPTEQVKTKFRVLLNNNGKPVTDTRVLAQYAQDQYQGGNLWGENYIQIAELSNGQGVKPKITGTSYVGNKIAVDFELTPRDRAVIHENYKIVQAEVNRVEEISRQFANNNEIVAFFRGVLRGAYKAVKGTIDLVLDLPGTLKALWQVVAHPVDTFNALKQELSETWEEFKNAGPSKKAEMIGEVVGQAIVEILIGKGIGKAGGILAKTKTGAKLLEEANNLKKAGLLKLAETFSDDAAEIARRSAKNRLRQLASQLNSGLPIDPQLLKDLTILSGNKLKNGAIKFADFAKQMVDELGEKVKPYLEKLYREGMTGLGLADNIDEAEVKSVRLANLSQPGAYTTKIKWGIQEVDVRPDGKGFWGKRVPQTNSRVDAFERKINPNNESYYIEHPNGGYVQFENIERTALQDGKLIMQPNNSIYRVYDKPPFLRKKILDEAMRQVNAAKHNGLTVEWLVSDRETVNQLTRFFKENSVDIKVRYLAE